MRLPIILAGLTVSILASNGCRSTDRLAICPTAPAVEWSDLAPGQTLRIENGVQLVAEEKTTGVFPTSIAVARLTGVPRIADEPAAFDLHMKPEVDFLAWNSVFDDFRSISEVFPLNVMALDGADVTLHSLLTTANDLEAGLLLVYTEVHTNPMDIELRGAFYQIPDGQVLALIQSNTDLAYLAAHEADDDDDDDDCETSRDERELCDPRVNSIRQFESAARACLLNLMAADEPGDVVPPEGWIPDRPFEPIEWPPVEDRYRRR
jgi:hypothetical protein